MKSKNVLEFVNQVNHRSSLRKLFTLIFSHTLEKLGKTENYRVSLTLVDEMEMQSLNRTYRDTDRPTDVLTFAFQEADVFSSDGFVDLGNIIICPEVAKRQAEQFHHPVDREMAFLFIHGLLHSFGYEHHRSKKEAEEMFALQNEILNTLPYDFYTNMTKVKKLLLKAQEMSISPYSHFRVGAVIMTRDGKYHLGFNIENSAYGDSMCAERVSMFSTYAKGYHKEDIVSLSLITDSKNVGTPCGSCRQVMSELLDQYTPVHIFNADMTKSLDTTVEALLPYNFNSEDLNK